MIIWLTDQDFEILSHVKFMCKDSIDKTCIFSGFNRFYMKKTTTTITEPKKKIINVKQCTKVSLKSSSSHSSWSQWAGLTKINNYTHTYSDTAKVLASALQAYNDGYCLLVVRTILGLWPVTGPQVACVACVSSVTHSLGHLHLRTLIGHGYFSEEK